MSASLLADLPDDVREIIEPHVAETPATLEAISLVIAQKRDDAKSARASSGIEQTWKECEEAYIGIDDANRHEFQDAKWAKPVSMDGPVTTGKAPRGTEHKSTAYVRLTSRYVDAGAAKIGEILLPADDKAFSFSEMPVPDLVKAKEDTRQVVHEGMGVPLTRPAQPGEPVPGAPPAGGVLPPAAPAPPVAAPAALLGAAPAVAGSAPEGAPGAGGAGASPAPPPAQSAAPPQVPLTVKDFALENIEIAHKSAKAAETRIYDWLIDCQYQAQMRKVIADAARIGTGVLKAPVPRAKRETVVEGDSKNGLKIGIKEKVVPSAAWVDPWNIFPDPACGENIHDGDFIFERDFMSARQVRDLKNVPGYIGSQIDKVLEEGPDKSNKDSDGGLGGAPSASKQKGRFAVWYFYGSLKREEMNAINAAAGKPDSAATKSEQIYAIITLINDSVVRATINPLDSGSFPYHAVPWQRRAGHWAGVGVAEQVRMPQRTVNAATRAMLNNAGKSAGSQIVLDQGAIKPADGNWTSVPDKIWYKTADAAGSDVRQSFMAIEIPNVTDALMKIVDYALQLAEESSSIPLITQGQSGPTQPDTLGAANLQNNNANQLLRSIGYAFDDYITEPVIRQFYEWLLLDPDVPDEEKAEFTINAHGSNALVERAIQDQTIAQMANVVANPIYGVDPKRWMKEFLRSKRLDPELFQYSEEEQAKLDAAPPQEAPQVTAARIAADTQIKLGVMKQTTEAQSLQSEQQIEHAANVLEGGRIENEQHKTAVQATIDLHKEQMLHDRALMEYANRRNISLDQAKAQLARTAMTLQTQRELNAADNAVDLHKHHTQPPRPARGARPPVQTPGRAGNGRAFEQGPAQ